MNFEVSNIFGHYEGRIDESARKVHTFQPSIGASVTLDFDDFRDVNPSPALATTFGNGCRGIHIKVCDLINEILESEREPATPSPNLMERLRQFCSRHYTLITIALSVLGVLIALVALF